MTGEAENARVARNAVFVPFLVLFAIPVGASAVVLAGAPLVVVGLSVFVSKWRAVRPDPAATAFSKLTKAQQVRAGLLCFALLVHFALCGWFPHFLWSWHSLFEAVDQGFKG